MTENVIKFPTAHIEKRIKDAYNGMFARMLAAGMTQQEIHDVLLNTVKEMGGVEVDGVWRIPSGDA